MVELIGYLASALVVLSLGMRSVVRLRSVSLVGSVVFVAYGVLLPSVPIVLTNAAVAVLNVWFLRKELNTSASPSVAAVPIEADAPFLRDYLSANAADIRVSQPEYRPSPDDEFVRLVTRDGLPAGVFIARPLGDELDVVLDYVTPAYRDSTTAKWLFGPGRSAFTDAGFRRLVADPTTTLHRTYLESVGFRPEGNRMVLELTGR